MRLRYEPASDPLAQPYTVLSHRNGETGSQIPGVECKYINFWKAEDAQGTPTQCHISPSILGYEEKGGSHAYGIACGRL